MKGKGPYEMMRSFRSKYLEPLLGDGIYTNTLVFGLYETLTEENLSEMPLNQAFSEKGRPHGVIRTLRNLGILTLSEITEHTEGELAGKRIGPVKMRFIKSQLETYGLSLKGEDIEPVNMQDVSIKGVHLDSLSKRLETVFTERGVGTIAKNALESQGIKTLAGVVKLTENKLRGIKGVGSTTVRHIKRKLYDLGLSLKNY